MRRTAIVSLATLIGLGLAESGSQAVAAGRSKIAPEVQDALATLPAAQQVSVIVHLSEQADLKPFRGLGRAKRLRDVGQALRVKADAAQGRLRGLLNTRKAQGAVTSYTSFWVFDGLAVTATPSVIEELASYPEVAAITPDETAIVPVALPPTPEPNLSAIDVPGLWSHGLYGEGIVVAAMDSGVDINHPELAATWRGGSNSWYDPYGQHLTTPTDRSGHGTWTMGVLAAADTGATAIGIAPLARWIAVKIFNDTGAATATAIHKGFQWLLDPDGNPSTADAPGVVNNSWSYGAPGCNLEFQADLQALRAAGILPVFAAGNFGPGPQTSVSPANYPEAFAVGAIDNGGNLDVESSAGPSSCGEPTGIYPELVAPGIDILTADLYGLYGTYSGTSMAAPHVTGTLALLLGAYPDLSATQQALALINGAVDLGPAGPDNSFGFGGLDAGAAYQWLQAHTGPTTSGVGVSPNPSNGGSAVGVTAALIDATHTVSAAEGFIDTAGANGSGFALLPSDGVFDSMSESVQTTIPGMMLDTLADGAHVVYVHGQNDQGNWGETGSTGLVIDRTAPQLLAASVTPNPTAGAVSVVLGVSASDAASNIAAGEWFEGADPGLGRAKPMAAADGIYSSPSELLSTTISTSGWSVGTHALAMRAADAVGNWSPPTSVLLSVSAAAPPSGALFADGFDSGGLGAWASSVNAGSRISAASAAKQAGSYGMQALISRSTSGYVADTTPANETSYHARFYFNANGVTAGSVAHDILVGLNAANQTVFRVQLRRSGGNYQTGVQVMRSRGTTSTSWYNIGTGFHAIEIAWQSASKASVGLSIDGAVKQTLTGLDTSAYKLEAIRLGPQGTLSNVAGTEYFDSFVSTRNTVIGP
jgi:serine protease AprX